MHFARRNRNKVYCLLRAGSALRGQDGLFVSPIHKARGESCPDGRYSNGYRQWDDRLQGAEFHTFTIITGEGLPFYTEHVYIHVRLTVSEAPE